MNRILVEELKPGMRFTKEVMIDSSNVLAAANVPIQESDIKRLMKWGISEVTTEGQLLTGAAGGGSVAISEQFNKVLDDYNVLISLKDQLIEVHTRTVKEVSRIHTAIRNDRMFNIQELTKCVEDIYNLIRQNRNVFLFVQRQENEKDTMAVHSVNSAIYAMVIGLTLEYSRSKVKDLGIGVLLINAGMVQIPLYIVNKEGDLNERELQQIKSHPVLGYQVLKNLGNISEDIAQISLQHHEQFNGGGYPKRLKGIEISEAARIASVADNYEAMVEKKSYRPRHFYYTAMKQLVATGARKFDPVILRMFISILSVYPIGSLVELNNKKIGVVIGTIKDNPLRPIVKMVRDEKGERVKGVEIINLVEEFDLFITQTIDEYKAGINLSELF
ncbi:MAG TPA: HD-GYP domain-containing protein [Spirochaetota bacterium]|nr:HD-GYP domain-containing protein [Spirochaetota bacterium]